MIIYLCIFYFIVHAICTTEFLVSFFLNDCDEQADSPFMFSEFMIRFKHFVCLACIYIYYDLVFFFFTIGSILLCHGISWGHVLTRVGLVMSSGIYKP